jgi:carboxypeptidase C (cathepsin A)
MSPLGEARLPDSGGSVPHPAVGDRNPRQWLRIADTALDERPFNTGYSYSLFSREAGPERLH